MSENVSDWQQNLANSWQQFKDNFIKIRQREDIAIEPLLTEYERHLIQQRLSLYLSQAQDALLTKQASIYFTALSQAEVLVKDYFQHDEALTKSTLKALQESTEQIKEWAK